MVPVLNMAQEPLLCVITTFSAPTLFVDTIIPIFPLPTKTPGTLVGMYWFWGLTQISHASSYIAEIA
jgi:hypothetical protein